MEHNYVADHDPNPAPIRIRTLQAWCPFAVTVTYDPSSQVVTLLSYDSTDDGDPFIRLDDRDVWDYDAEEWCSMPAVTEEAERILRTLTKDTYRYRSLMQSLARFSDESESDAYTDTTRLWEEVLLPALAEHHDNH